MKQEPGLWISIGGGELAGKIQNAIEKYKYFTFPISQGDYHPRQAELVVVSLCGSRADYLGISIRSKTGTTGQMTVGISNLIPIAPRKEAVLRESLPKRLRGGFNPPISGIYRPTPKLWEELLSILTPSSPENGERLDRLKRAIRAANQRVSGNRGGGLEAFERDAVASALQAWGGQRVRRRILKNAAPTADERAPFLARLKDVTSREDPQINHDFTAFPGMTIARRDVVSSVTLSDEGEQITILNCNRQPLEETLGVDLIYYSHQFKSFVMVQYKRMVDDGGVPAYRPHSDENHAKEVKRMQATEELLQTLPIGTSDDTFCFRLSSDPFFMKLCEARASVALDSGMITSEIVERVLSSHRMLVLAATEPGTGSKDYRRDNLGRFASEEDPEAAF